MIIRIRKTNGGRTIVKFVDYNNCVSKEVLLNEFGKIETRYYVDCPKCFTDFLFENDYVKPMKMRQMARWDLILCCACMINLCEV